MPDLPNMASPREVVLRLNHYGLKPLQSRGQNFLIDSNVVQNIVEAASVENGDAVVEVGPGAGALTLALAGRKARILALEVDRGLVRLLRDLLQSCPAVKVVQGDALKADWRALCRLYFGEGEKVKLVSNLPYNISTPFVYSLLKQLLPFERAVLMFQREVAERITAMPGDGNYGALTVLCQYYAAPGILFKVSRHVFWPRPKVDSAVLSLTPRERLLTAHQEPYFWRIVQGSFQQRRKTMLNNLLNLYDWPRDAAAGMLLQASIEPSARPETVSLQKFAKLSRIIYNYYGNID
jgi:16S rRNA (adenine1518-N6/adenine1519-N6)-dimethyltransferase